MTARTYPLRRPDNDPRFSVGFTLDIVLVLERHGYPPVTDGGDLVALRQALFGFLYGTGNPQAGEQ